LKRSEFNSFALYSPAEIKVCSGEWPQAASLNVARIEFRFKTLSQRQYKTRVNAYLRRDKTADLAFIILHEGFFKFKTTQLTHRVKSSSKRSIPLYYLNLCIMLGKLLETQQQQQRHYFLLLLEKVIVARSHTP